ncbi:MAG: hypothetical protein KAS69_05010 [Planctomycetes bacterium]|nr:hypothetical protein [Planctomycetota bacterium]
MSKRIYITFSFLALLCFVLLQSAAFGVNSDALEMQKQEYTQDMNSIRAMRKSLSPGQTNDLGKYEQFADEIRDKWKQESNREYYARLMLEICKPLTSGGFKSNRRFVLAREYALSALEEPDKISVTIELELTDHVITKMYAFDAPKGEDFAQSRKKDLEVRLHTWKRLITAIDPSWDPNEVTVSPNVVAISMGFPGTIESETIQDTDLRDEYETAMQKNQQKIERYSEQDRLRKWRKRFSRTTESYVVRAYSEPPFKTDELSQCLDSYLTDEQTKTRIIDTVTETVEKKIQSQAENVVHTIE